MARESAGPIVDVGVCSAAGVGIVALSITDSGYSVSYLDIQI